MRKIKFRAWDEGNKMMHHNFQFIKSGEEGNDWIVFTSDKQTLQDKHHPLENPYFQQQLKIMQFTGLLDKQGKQIYESDIVRIYGSISRDDPAYGAYEPIAVIEWGNEGAYELISDEGKFIGTLQYNTKQLEVIGNIYENPELLK